MAARVLTPIGLFALALAIRLLPWPTVLEQGRVVFFGMDAWYHMRRVHMALAWTGWPPAFDPYLNFPHGAMPIWPPWFDAGVAAFAWPAWALGGLPAAERAAALLPPLLGAFCVVVLYRIALRLFDFGLAVLAGVMLSFLSAHFWYSQIGFVDHHVAEALATTLLLGSALVFCARLSRGDGCLRPAATTGLLCAVCLLLWPGTLLHVGIVALGLGIAWASLSDATAATRGILGLAVAAAVAFAITAPAGALSGWPGSRAFSPTVLSWFQAWMFGSLAVVGAACFGVLRSPASPGTRHGRVLLALALLAGVLGLGMLALPELLTGIGDAWRWFAKDEVFQELVRESKPLFVAESGLSVGNAELRLSRFLYLLPVAGVVLALEARAWRRPDWWLLCGWTLLLALATLLQRRFFNSLSPAFALVIAWSCVYAGRQLLAHIPEVRTWRRRGAVAALVAAGLWLFAPTLESYRLPVANLVQRAQGEPMTVPRAQLSRRVLMDAAEWLRMHTPPTAGPLDPAARPEYGVMAQWGYGHLLNYVARRPTVVGNFGDDVGDENLPLSFAYFASAEPEASRILEQLRVRYVLVFTLDERLEGPTMRQRLSLDDSPGLAHHRLVYESPLDGRSARSEFRIFEHVPGARLVGEAKPGAAVGARLAYTSNRGRRGLFESAALADADGRYELRLPYANRGGPPGVIPDTSYQVLSEGSEGRAVRVSVSESEVQSGAPVRGPSFR